MSLRVEGVLRDAARALRVLRRSGPGALLHTLRFAAKRAWWRRSRRRQLADGETDIAILLGMTTPEEREWLHAYAREQYRGEGEIADLGCWLGSTTIALVAGLDAAKEPVPNRRVFAYDLFQWEDWMEDSVAGTALAGKLAPGESFLPLFEERVASVRNRIVARPGDLLQERWTEPRGIELLFNDASKTWELANHVLRHFHAALIPGRSTLVEQDFAHFYTPWIHLIHWRLRDDFEPVEHVPFSGSMVFRPVRAIHHPLPDRDLTFADFAEDEIAAAFERSLRLVDSTMRPSVWAARVMLEIHRDRRERAGELYAESARRGFRGQDLDKVRPLLQ